MGHTYGFGLKIVGFPTTPWSRMISEGVLHFSASSQPERSGNPGRAPDGTYGPVDVSVGTGWLFWDRPGYRPPIGTAGTGEIEPNSAQMTSRCVPPPLAQMDIFDLYIF